MLLEEEIIDSTILIRGVGKDGEEFTGTGLFMIYNIEDSKPDYGEVALIVNKHTLKDHKELKITFTLADSFNQPIRGLKYDLKFRDIHEKVFYHPEKDVDLCVIPFANVYKTLKDRAINLYIKALPLSMIPTKNDMFKPIQNVIMIGYPQGRYDSYNNLPIHRKGITATNINYDFENKPMFLIDAFVYPGSSGSPIFSTNYSSSLDQNCRLIGINVGVTKYQNQPSGLGLAIKSQKLLDFIPIIKDALNKHNK